MKLINLAKCKIGQWVRLRNKKTATLIKVESPIRDDQPYIFSHGGEDGLYYHKVDGCFWSSGEKSDFDIVALLPLPKKKAKAKNRNIDTNNQHKDIYSRKPNTLDRFTSAFAKIAFKGDNDLIRKAAEQLEGLLKP